MAILQRSCCCDCCGVKTGSIVIAVLWIGLTLIGIGYAANNAHSVSTVFGLVSPTDVVVLVVYSVNLIAHILLMVGVAKEVRPLLLTWMIVTTICTVVLLLVNIYVTTTAFTAPRDYTDRSNKDAAIAAANLTGTGMRWILWGIFLTLTIYGCLVVLSHYQNLRDAEMGRGQQQMVVMGNLPYVMGNQPIMPGIQPYGNQPVLENKQPAMTGPQPGLGQDSSDARL
ncbi:Hypp5865 [Branchiostoma lanceolatum]|uniref:Hypp5865 protein n=1 Tax=Branchiostoma lanceolatum TaxID=7740 RepID=A0A8J9YRX5_BRALA|nr:Hypp5865 [Branchiostoma lanceolatum]